MQTVRLDLLLFCVLQKILQLCCEYYQLFCSGATTRRLLIRFLRGSDHALISLHCTLMLSFEMVLFN